MVYVYICTYVVQTIMYVCMYVCDEWWIISRCCISFIWTGKAKCMYIHTYEHKQLLMFIISILQQLLLANCSSFLFTGMVNAAHAFSSFHLTFLFPFHLSFLKFPFPIKTMGQWNPVLKWRTTSTRSALGTVIDSRKQLILTMKLFPVSCS
jgi:hypothetical protein